MIMMPVMWQSNYIDSAVSWAYNSDYCLRSVEDKMNN